MPKQRKSRQEIDMENLKAQETAQSTEEVGADGEEEVYLPEFVEQTVFSALSEQEGFTLQHMPDLIFSLIDIAAKWHVIIGGSVDDFNSATAEIITEYDKNKEKLIAAFKESPDNDLSDNEDFINLSDDNNSPIEKQIDENEALEDKNIKPKTKEKKQSKKNKQKK